MTYDIKIAKGGNLVSREWDSEAADFVEEKICGEELYLHLHSSVCLGVGITLRDIFVLLSKDIIGFSAITGCPFLEELIAESLSDPVFNTDKEKIALLELSRFAVVHNAELHLNFDFHGRGEKDEYALEFSPLNELVHIPLVLDEKVSIINGDTEEVYLKTNMTYTLADLLTGIVEELAFIGPPDIKAFALQELKDRAVELDETTEGMSFKDLSKRIDDKIEANKIPCKWCGKDARSQHFDKPKDLCGDCFELTKEN